MACNINKGKPAVSTHVFACLFILNNCFWGWIVSDIPREARGAREILWFWLWIP